MYQLEDIGPLEDDTGDQLADYMGTLVADRTPPSSNHALPPALPPKQKARSSNGATPVNGSSQPVVPPRRQNRKPNTTVRLRVYC